MNLKFKLCRNAINSKRKLFLCIKACAHTTFQCQFHMHEIEDCFQFFWTLRNLSFAAHFFSLSVRFPGDSVTRLHRSIVHWKINLLLSKTFGSLFDKQHHKNKIMRRKQKWKRKKKTFFVGFLCKKRQPSPGYYSTLILTHDYQSSLSSK